MCYLQPHKNRQIKQSLNMWRLTAFFFICHLYGSYRDICLYQFSWQLKMFIHTKKKVALSRQCIHHFRMALNRIDSCCPIRTHKISISHSTLYKNYQFFFFVKVQCSVKCALIDGIRDL